MDMHTPETLFLEWWHEAVRIMTEDYNFSFVNPQYVRLTVPLKEKEPEIYNYFGVLDGQTLYIIRESETVPDSAYHQEGMAYFTDTIVWDDPKQAEEVKPGPQ
jgi:hypothetical protein